MPNSRRAHFTPTKHHREVLSERLLRNCKCSKKFLVHNEQFKPSLTNISKNSIIISHFWHNIITSHENLSQHIYIYIWIVYGLSCLVSSLKVNIMSWASGSLNSNQEFWGTANMMQRSQDFISTGYCLFKKCDLKKSLCAVPGLTERPNRQFLKVEWSSCSEYHVYYQTVSYFGWKELLNYDFSFRVLLNLIF